LCQPNAPQLHRLGACQILFLKDYNDLKLANECIRTLNVSSGNTILLDLNRAQEFFELIQHIAERVFDDNNPNVVDFKEAVEEFNKRVQEHQQEPSQ
jgi:hypothetical protein